MGAIVPDHLPDVLGVLVLGQHDGMLVVGVVLHATAMYMPSSPPRVAVGPHINLVFGVHHLVSAGSDRDRCFHNTGGRRGPTCWTGVLGKPDAVGVLVEGRLAGVLVTVHHCLGTVHWLGG